MFKWFLNKKTGFENIMSSGRLFVGLSALLFVLISSSAYSETSIYSWQDETGTVSFSDNPANAPSNAEMNVLQGEEIPTVSDTGFTQVVTPQPEAPPRIATQGEFAARLVEELGLAEDPTEDEAADLLVSARISPKLGEWELDQPMSPELTVRLRKLTVAAADRGWITLTPEQSLLAFDTASALMGLTIPVTTDVEETVYAPVPIAETPPLVYVEMPPPAIYPYYVWTPVPDGFWWNGFVLPGFFVLDVNIYVSDHHRKFRGNPGILDPGRIRHQFRNRIIDHPVTRPRAVPNTGRIDRSAFHPGPGGGSDRVTELPTSRDPVRYSGSDQSKARPGRRYISPRPAPTDPEIRQRSKSARPDEGIHELKSSPSRRPDSTSDARLLSPRPVEPKPRVKPSISRSVGPAPDSYRRTPPSGGQALPRPRESVPAVKPLPPPKPLERNISDAAPVPRQPSPPMDQRSLDRPFRNGPDNVAGRGPSGR